MLPILAGFRSGGKGQAGMPASRGARVGVPVPVCSSIHHAPCVRRARAEAELGRDGAAAWGHGSVRAKGEEGEGEGDETPSSVGCPWPPWDVR